MSEKIVGIGLVGEPEGPAWPRSRVPVDRRHGGGVLRVAGSTIICRQLDELRRNGVYEVHLLTDWRGNRRRVASAIGDDRRSGMDARHLRSVPDLTGTALIFPTDMLFRVDLASMVAAHRRRGAAVTVATRSRRAHEVIDDLDLAVLDGAGRVVRLEATTWSMRETRSPAFRAPPPISTGMYLVESGVLRDVQQDSALGSWDGELDLLPAMVRRGVPVMAHPVRDVAHVGTLHGFLCSLPQILSGALGAVVAPDAGYVDLGGQRWVHESTLARADPVSGRTLADKLAAGLVRIGPNVRLGRDVEVQPGVSVCTADVDDDTTLGLNADLRRVTCGTGTRIGESATLSDCELGALVEIASDAVRPTRVSRFSALGAAVTVPAGAHLLGVYAYPDTRIPSGIPTRVGSVLGDPRESRNRTTSRSTVSQFVKSRPVRTSSAPVGDD